jgi:hypothetical protein
MKYYTHARSSSNIYTKKMGVEFFAYSHILIREVLHARSSSNIYTKKNGSCNHGGIFVV